MRPRSERSVSRTPRGLSIAELLVAASISLLISAVLYRQLTQTIEISTRMATRAQLQETGAVLLRRVQQLISSCRAEGIGVYCPPCDTAHNKEATTLSFHPVATLDSNGLLTFEPQLTVLTHDRTTHQLAFATWNQASLSVESINLAPLEAFRPSPAQLISLGARALRKGRVLSDCVTRFEVVGSQDDGNVRSPFHVRIELERQATARHSVEQQPERATVERTFTLRI